eukprot:1142257-Pyramimonas_sp.AAC.1
MGEARRVEAVRLRLLRELRGAVYREAFPDACANNLPHESFKSEKSQCARHYAHHRYNEASPEHHVVDVGERVAEMK